MSKRNKYEGLTPEQIEQKKAKERKVRIILLAIFVPLIAVFVVNVAILPFTGAMQRVDKVDYTGDNQFIKDKPVLVAHRMGADVLPEETMLALKGAWESGKVDVMEFDIHMTSDGVPVLIHDGTLDRTSDSIIKFGAEDIKIEEKTYQELRSLNMGYNFKDKDGNYPYRYQNESDVPEDLRIITLQDALAYLDSVDTTHRLEYVIEVKNKGDMGKKAMDMLYSEMVKYDMLDRTVVGTFQADISKYIDEKYLDLGVTRSASILEVLNFYFAFLWGVPLDTDNLGYTVLQIPMGLSDVFANFATEALIDYAHAYDVAVQYWTINDADDVALLTSIGADGIMTDDYHMAYEMINAR